MSSKSAFLSFAAWFLIPRITFQYLSLYEKFWLEKKDILETCLRYNTSCILSSNWHCILGLTTRIWSNLMSLILRKEWSSKQIFNSSWVGSKIFNLQNHFDASVLPYFLKYFSLTKFSILQNGLFTFQTLLFCLSTFVLACFSFTWKQYTTRRKSWECTASLLWRYH